MLGTLSGDRGLTAAVSYQRCDAELKRWLAPAAIAKGVDRGNPNRWCARWEPPAAMPKAADGCPASM